MNVSIEDLEQLYQKTFHAQNAYVIIVGDIDFDAICKLFIGGAELDEDFVKAASNLPFVDVLPQQGINVYDILRRDILVLSKDAAAHLEERLK